eukprot:CAMPEP_0206028630 /NCGR_PEP_ID=MMETSP1464-20131121/45270_1 /ASSEMBLY_ACC=CAM_ASM_001124 /TAXON_ID=119497 /ORGANISM="Exanthemachrysis gayraliae, Strain RCC1523" /LENGTH=49 /DNA_ID= /DNA_START= /DNA_END= /DNA_ORIENTATION=
MALAGTRLRARDHLVLRHLAPRVQGRHFWAPTIKVVPRRIGKGLEGLVR